MSRLLLVMGCHRSGTSLIARSLKCLGAALGEAAEWSGPDNPTGFWEHQGVLAVNEQVLRLCRSHWKRPPDSDFLTEACRTVPELIYLRGAAEHMLRRELGERPLFAIKDPRLCVLMPFWQPVLSGLGCEVSVVRVVRHPDAVAASLYRRDGMDRDMALDLWLRYTEAANREASASVVVDYDIMVHQPATELLRLARRLGLTLARHEGHLFVTAFLDERLYHEPEERTLTPDVNIVWQQVRREAAEP